MDDLEFIPKVEPILVKQRLPLMFYAIWAVQNGLIVGSGNALNPQGDTTHTEVATILMRYTQQIIS